MSFISSVRRALGFPGDFDSDEELEDDELNDDEELEDDPDPILEELATAGDNPLEALEGASSLPAISDEEIKTFSASLFDSVLKYFNSHQPELVQRCLDLDAQRALIIEELDSDVRASLRSLTDAACRRGESMWAEKQQRMGAELMKLKSEFNAVRQQREEYQNAQLSATRQKRALNDRIRDLESQVMQLEAEREQYQLENRSMAARLRSIDSAHPTLPAPASDNKEAESLLDKVKQLTEALATAEANASRASDEIAVLKRQMDPATAASSEGQSELMAEKLHELTELQESIEPLRQLKDAAEAKVIELTKETKQSDATIANLQKRLGEAAKSAEETSAEIDRLKSTIETNLYAHAEAEAELRAEIKRLNELLIAPRDEAAETSSAETYTQSAQARRRKKKRKKREIPAQFPGMTDEETISDTDHRPVKISAIDELMDSTDWFVAPEPIPLKKDPEVEEIFGYKEPAKKNDNPEDDRQLTLW